MMIMSGSQSINSYVQLYNFMHIDENLIQGLDSYIIQANGKFLWHVTQHSNARILEENDILNHLKKNNRRSDFLSTPS